MVEVMITLHVNATRNKRGWTLVGVEYGAVSEVTRLDQAVEDMREPLAYLSGLPEDAFDIKVIPEIPQTYYSERAEADRFWREADTARSLAAEHSRKAARVLAGEGLPLRDIGQIMGISYQRAHQLVSA